MIMGERLSFLEIGGLFVCAISVLLIAYGGEVSDDLAGNLSAQDDNIDDS